MIRSGTGGLAGFPARCLGFPEFSSLRFLPCDTTGSRTVLFSFPFSRKLAFWGLTCRNIRGGNKGGRYGFRIATTSANLRQHAPPLYYIPSQRTSQAILFSVICSAGIQGTGATCFFFSFPSSAPARREQKKGNLDWLFSSWYWAWRRSDRKQDSTQPQAGATCCQGSIRCRTSHLRPYG